MVGSAGGVGAATVAVVSRPGPGLPGDDVGVTTLTETLIGTKSFLDDSVLGAGSLGDLCSMLWWKGLKADAPAVGGCVCEW